MAPGSSWYGIVSDCARLSDAIFLLDAADADRCTDEVLWALLCFARGREREVEDAPDPLDCGESSLTVGPSREDDLVRVALEILLETDESRLSWGCNRVRLIVRTNPPV